jgi:nicotinamide mononucleotide transporter
MAVAYLLLVIYQNIWCWAAALTSVVLYLFIFFDARLYMESALQIFYAAMAVYGWYQWKYGGTVQDGLPITTWRPRVHLLVVAAVLCAAIILGKALSMTDAAYPYLDSFTTAAAIVATYMVARKVLENWIYWFVIDALSVYLYASRDLYLTAVLYAVYLVLIVIGFRQWLRDWRRQSQAAP